MQNKRKRICLSKGIPPQSYSSRGPGACAFLIVIRYTGCGWGMILNSDH